MTGGGTLPKQQTPGGSRRGNQGMPAPRKPNTAPATAVVARRGQDVRAAHLRDAGWVVIPPGQQDKLPDLPADARVEDWLAARGLPRDATVRDLIAHERAIAARRRRPRRPAGS